MAGHLDVPAALRVLADALAAAGDLPPAAISLTVWPRPADESDDAVIAAVDAYAQTLLGRAGETTPVGGSFHHGAKGTVGPVRVDVYRSVSNPAERELRAEIARLRERLGEQDGGQP